MDNFADRLRAARIAAKLTQEQLGFEVEVTKSSVSAWENGRETPSFRVLALLPGVLSCSLDHLVGVGGQAGSAGEKSATYQPANCARDASETKLLDLYRSLPGARKKALLDLLRSEK